jgi:hypothetical protein
LSANSAEAKSIVPQSYQATRRLLAPLLSPHFGSWGLHRSSVTPAAVPTTFTTLFPYDLVLPGLPRIEVSNAANTVDKWTAKSGVEAQRVIVRELESACASAAYM